MWLSWVHDRAFSPRTCLPLWSGLTQKYSVPGRNFQKHMLDQQTANKWNYSRKSHSSGHPFVCDVVHRWTHWWNNNNVSLVYQQVSKNQNEIKSPSLCREAGKAFCIVGSNIIFCFLLSLMLFWCGSHEADLWWIPFVLIWEDRFPWELGNRELFVRVRGKEMHTLMFCCLQLSVWTLIDVRAERPERKRENASAVCFMRCFCQQKVRLQSYSFWFRFVGAWRQPSQGKSGNLKE